MYKNIDYLKLYKNIPKSCFILDEVTEEDVENFINSEEKPFEILDEEIEELTEWFIKEYEKYMPGACKILEANLKNTKETDMFTQVVQIDKKELVELLNSQMFEIRQAVVTKAQGRSTDVPTYSVALDTLKARHLNYYVGRATTLLKMIELHGVYVDKDLFEDMKALCRKFKK